MVSLSNLAPTFDSTTCQRAEKEDDRGVSPGSKPTGEAIGAQLARDDAKE